ncbi:MAG: hypothetical protein WB611_09675 [Stellaceae bacterium]
MNGDALGEAIGRMARLPLVVCSLLVWIGGVLSRPRVFAALVVFIAAGVWMHGGLAEIHWPQWAKIALPQWSQQSQEEIAREAMKALSKPASQPADAAPTYKPQEARDLDRLIDNSRSADSGREARDAMNALSKPAVVEKGCEFPLSEKMQLRTPCEVSVRGGWATVYFPDGKRRDVKTGTKIDFVRMHDDSSGYAVVRLPDSIVCWPGGNWSAPLESIPKWDRPHFNCQDRLAERNGDQSERRPVPAPAGEGLTTAYSLTAP